MGQQEFPITYSESDAAQYLSISVSTIRRRRRAGTGPEFYRIGKVLRYRLDALERYVELNTRQKNPNTLLAA
jgi:hypothetical protein